MVDRADSEKKGDLRTHCDYPTQVKKQVFVDIPEFDIEPSDLIPDWKSERAVDWPRTSCPVRKKPSGSTHQPRLPSHPQHWKLLSS